MDEIAHLGVLEGLEKRMKDRIFENTVALKGIKNPMPVVVLKDISFYIHERQLRRLDSFVGIYGDNGLCKSTLALMLLKTIKQEENKEFVIKDSENILYAHSGHKEFMQKINKFRKECIMIDETGAIFSAKEHATVESRVSMYFLEVARERSNAMIFCSKDFFTTNYSLRNGKIGIAIWIWDRVEGNGNVKAYAYVFLGSNIMQSEDKFDLEKLKQARGFEEWRIIAESSSSFIGIMEIPDMYDYLTKEEIAIYEKKKDEGINALLEKNVRRLETKELKGQAEDSKNKEFIRKTEENKPKELSPEELQEIEDKKQERHERMLKNLKILNEGKRDMEGKPISAKRSRDV
jgi:energy-coupling factor transporter ATP-binding protein EcfA2